MDEDKTYPIWGIYTTGKQTNVDYIALCKTLKDITVDVAYFDKKYKVTNPAETIIHEVKMLMPQQKIAKQHASLLDKKDMTLNDIETATAKLKKALKEYIVSQWDSNAKHFMFHSSGYDSRIVSGLLAELRNENGKEWIGDIHFRCHQPEGEMFMKIMKAEGWDANQYSNFNGPDNDHYDIGRVDNPVYGFLPHYLTFNFWRDIIPPGKEKEYTLITGIYGGEMTDYPTRNIYSLGLKFCDNYMLNRWLNYIADRGMYYSQMHEKFKALILPYCSYEYLNTVTDMNNKLFRRQSDAIDYIRYNLLKSFKMDLLSAGYVGHNYNFKYSQERQKHIVSSWNGSKLMKKYGHLPGVKAVNPLSMDTYDASMYGFMTCYEAIA